MCVELLPKSKWIRKSEENTLAFDDYTYVRGRGGALGVIINLTASRSCPGRHVRAYYIQSAVVF